jgi:zinc protease
MTTRVRLLFVAALLFTFAGGRYALDARPAAPQGTAATAALTSTIPTDSTITIGRLPNGLRYYVRANRQPEKRAELRLVVNAGSVLEEDDQRGLAHFVEHMAFNGTAHFPGHDIISFMQSIGMRFGPSVNAFTSFDETVYMLQVPTDRPDVLDRAMLALEDWAHAVTFDAGEIDKERGVILEEWRLRRGADARLQDKQFPILLQGSRYAERLPIGQPEIIQTFKPERLRQFYADWYRPDLMAVIAVGDIDAAAVEQSIRTHFGPMTAPANARPRPAYDVPGLPGTRYAIATDPEARETEVSVYHTMAARDQSTIASYRQQILEGLYSSMLNARFAEIAQKPDAPILGASAGHGSIVRTAEASMLSAAVPDGGVEAGLDALFTEAERVARFGFTATELDRERTRMLRSMQQAVTAKADRTSASYAAEYMRNFTTGEPIPGIDYEYALYQRFLPEITLAEINALARGWVPDENRVVMVGAPDKPGAVPTEARLAAVMTGVERKDLTAYTDATGTRPLMASPPAPGRVTAVNTRDQYGITEWTLSNGARVILKPTTFKQDEVLVTAFSPGGTSLASDADYVAASTAAQVVMAGGLGSFSALDLRKVLTGKLASAGVYIGDTSEGLNGSASTKDLDTLFQLIHLRFTAPRKDPSIFEVMKTQTRAALANQAAQPEFAFSQALTEALWKNHPRMQPMTIERLDRMDLEKSFAFYKERFADAAGFTFVFVGSFTPEALRPLVETYLASLPATGRRETWKDVGIRPARGIVTRDVYKGLEPKSQTRIIFTGPFEYDQAHRVEMRAMAFALEGMLRETLREDLGGTYSVSASAGYDKIPQQQYTLSIGFGSAPDRTKDLVQRTFENIERLKRDGPTQQTVSEVRQVFLRDYETNSRENSFFLRELATRYELGENLQDLFSLTDFYSKVDAKMIQDAARRYLDLQNYVEVSLFPEKPATPAAAPSSAAPASR